LAGCVGSAHRMKYTTVGDTVNAAAHLENFGRETFAESPGRRPCRILVSEGTAQLLGHRFQLDPIGEVHLKGKTQSMQAYRIVTEKPAQGKTSS
jgi:adenylate cyclase